MSQGIVQVFAFRHGETDWNREGRLQGHSDIPLNDDGLRQAEGLGKFLKSHPLDYVFSSDLIRASQTAKIALGAGSSVPISFHPELRECFLGTAEGFNRHQLEEHFGEELISNWVSVDEQHLDTRLPGGESKREAIVRFDRFLRRSLSQVSTRVSTSDDLQDPKNLKTVKIGVATHGLVLRRWLYSIRKDLSHPIMTPNCVCFLIVWDGQNFSFENSIPVYPGSGGSPDYYKK